MPPVSPSDLWGCVHGAPDAAIFHGADIGSHPTASVSLQGHVRPCIPPYGALLPQPGGPQLCPPALSAPHTHCSPRSALLGCGTGAPTAEGDMQGGVKRLGVGAHRDLRDDGTNTARALGGCRGTLPAPPSPPHHIVRAAAQRDLPQPLCRGEGARGGETPEPRAAPRRPHGRQTRRAFAPCTPGAQRDTRSVAAAASTRTRGPTCAQSRRGRGPQRADGRGRTGRT